MSKDGDSPTPEKEETIDTGTDGDSSEVVMPLVVIGSSAGGIEALSILVSSLPKDFPAPIVLAQHLDPRRPSYLETILQRHSLLPVMVVQGTMPMQPGTIYVVPSNQHVAILDGHVGLEEDQRDRPRPSVDLLLSTAADSYGERLVAVILTGTGSDGASGAVDVKHAGGTVVIQNPNTARYPSMPLALPPTVVDHIADIEQIGPLLTELVNADTLRQPAEKIQDPLRDILARVSRQARIDFRQYKPTTILRRINRRMVTTHNRTMDEYVRYLERHPEEIGELVMAFLIKVTEFFRGQEAFTYIKDYVLPTLIENGRERGRVLRIWSAGCATGEEPYSLAMMLAEALGPELPEWNIRLFATDLDEGAVNFARRGFYPTSALRNLPDHYRQLYFEQSNSGYRISKFIRQMVIFGQQDLSRGAPFPRIDLVVCRNLLIYFKAELQQTMLGIFAYSLQPTNGYLFLGHAETVRPSQPNFELVSKKWKIYKCVTGPVTGSTMRGIAYASGRLPKRPNIGRPEGAESSHLAPEAVTTDAEIAHLRRFSEIVLRSYPFGAVIIDRLYRIITVNASARRLLGVRDLANNQDFLHTVNGIPYAEIRNAIDAAFQERAPITLPEVELEHRINSDRQFLHITITPLQADLGMSELAIVSVQDVTDAVQTKRDYEAMQAQQKQLMAELGEANKSLIDLNKHLQTANEELQAANEEMVLAQEELQATNEEFEATNEELQATNEEMETSNEELQATNEELETTNEELQARTSELEELARNLASEQLRLSEIVELAPFYIMLLRGPALIVEAINPSFKQLFDGRDLIGMPFEEVFYAPEMAELVGIVRDAYKRNISSVTTHRMGGRPSGANGQSVEKYFAYTIVTAHDSSGNAEGVVLYAEDVTGQLAREAEERREKLKLMVEHAEQVVLGLYDAQTTRLIQASARYLDVLQRTSDYVRDDIIGRKWQDLAFIAPKSEAVEFFSSVVDSGVSRRLPELRVPVDGDREETIWDYSLTPIAFTDGRASEEGIVRFVVVSGFEVTEQVRARTELERIDALKDMFLSLASHELRTPLVPLMGYSDMLAKLVAEKEKENTQGWDPRIGDYVSRFHRQIQHLNRLVDDLFDATRLQSGKFSLRQGQVDLSKVMQEAVEEACMFDPKRIINLNVAEDGEPYLAQADDERIRQLMSNLIQNALRYAPDSKPIEVRVRREHTNESDEAVIEVQDFGPGIASSDIPSLFMRFYQVSKQDRQAEGGLGLGLFIAKGIAEQHGGTITVDSVVGEGSTFAVRLPLLPSS